MFFLMPKDTVNPDLSTSLFKHFKILHPNPVSSNHHSCVPLTSDFLLFFPCVSPKLSTKFLCLWGPCKAVKMATFFPQCTLDAILWVDCNKQNFYFQRGYRFSFWNSLVFMNDNISRRCLTNHSFFNGLVSAVDQPVWRPNSSKTNI